MPVALAAGLLTAISMVACSNDSTTATAGSTTTRVAAATTSDIRAGDCLEPLTPAQTTAPILPTRVPCDQPHGGEIVAVYPFPDSPGAAYPAMGQTIVGGDQLSVKCGGDGVNEGDFDRFAGTSRLEVPADVKSTGVTDAWLVSGVQAGVFVPSPSQWAAGHRSYVCAAVLGNSTKVPASYTGSLSGIRQADGGVPAKFAWCKDQPDAQDSRTFEVVPCDVPHNAEQLASFSYGSSSTTFLGQKSEDDIARALCTKLDSAATHGRSDDLPAGFDVSWTFPVESEWNSGGRIGRCFVVTTTGRSTGTIATGTAKAG